MISHKAKFQRKSIRLKEYDYSQMGAYFVTIYTTNRESVFGQIVNEKMVLNDAAKWYYELQNKFPDVNAMNTLSCQTISMP